MTGLNGILKKNQPVQKMVKEATVVNVLIVVRLKSKYCQRLIICGVNGVSHLLQPVQKMVKKPEHVPVLAVVKLKKSP